jgi:hypothetical protein
VLHQLLGTELLVLSWPPRDRFAWVTRLNTAARAGATRSFTRASLRVSRSCRIALCSGLLSF